MLKKLAIAVFAAALVVLPALASGPLDGKTFHGKLTEVGKGGHADNFEFKNGQFLSTACQHEGFGSGAYTTEGSGPSFTFTAQTMSKKDGTMDWKGAVNGDSISGTATWTKSGMAPVNYTFEAKMK
ncbi:MAG TPA: hypothetical protein VFV19_16075 [Candidatus Polarisedimenticolaceae bacterium]|nr:hypothetical protein [Candidatus Polarisedimenticolaceae bacterium]